MRAQHSSEHACTVAIVDFSRTEHRVARLAEPVKSYIDSTLLRTHQEFLRP
jgi:hypothetical protein